MTNTANITNNKLHRLKFRQSDSETEIYPHCTFPLIFFFSGILSELLGYSDPSVIHDSSTCLTHYTQVCVQKFF